MSFYQVNSTNLRESSEQLMDLNRQFKEKKELLVADEQALSSMWEGEANQSFHQAFIRDAGQMDAFLQLIDSYIKVMEVIADRYDSAEAKNIGIANTRSY